MPDWINEWIAAAAGIAAVIGPYIAWRTGRGKKPPTDGSDTRVSIKNSPRAKGSGRDMGGGRGSTAPHSATVKIEDSPDAEGVGHDRR